MRQKRRLVKQLWSLSLGVACYLYGTQLHSRLCTFTFRCEQQSENASKSKIESEINSQPTPMPSPSLSWFAFLWLACLVISFFFLYFYTKVDEKEWLGSLSSEQSVLNTYLIILSLQSRLVSFSFFSFRTSSPSSSILVAKFNQTKEKNI